MVTIKAAGAGEDQIGFSEKKALSEGPLSPGSGLWDLGPKKKRASPTQSSKLVQGKARLKPAPEPKPMNPEAEATRFAVMLMRAQTARRESPIPPEFMALTEWPQAIKYSEAFGVEICRRVLEGETVHKLCKVDNPNGYIGVPAYRIRYWLESKPEFKAMYDLARELQADAMMDEILHVADNEKDAAKAKNMINVRMALAERLRPRKWGKNATMALTGADGGPLQVEIGTPAQRRAAFDMALTLVATNAVTGTQGPTSEEDEGETEEDADA